MSFSIIIPSFEDLDLLKLCLKSLSLNSCFTHQACISCSDEDVISFLEEHKNDYDNLFIDWIVINHGCGLSTGYNAAVSLAQHDYIVIADSDHVFSFEWDLKILPFVNDRTLVSLHRVETDTWGNHPNNFDLERFNKESQAHLSDKILEHEVFHPFIMSRVLYNKVGGMNVGFDLGALHDDEFWYRLYKYEKVNFIYCYQSLVFHFSSPKRLSLIPRSKKQIQDEWGKIAPDVFKMIYKHDWIGAQHLHELVK